MKTLQSPGKLKLNKTTITLFVDQVTNARAGNNHLNHGFITTETNQTCPETGGCTNSIGSDMQSCNTGTGIMTV